jgi:hypothetical protein
LPPDDWRNWLAVITTGVCFNGNALTELKTPEFAPTTSASAITTIKMKHDFFANIRSA